MGSGALSGAAARAACLEEARLEQNLNQVRVRVSCEVCGGTIAGMGSRQGPEPEQALGCGQQPEKRVAVGTGDEVSRPAGASKAQSGVWSW